MRFEKCPVWSKDQDLESWKKLVKIWDKTHQAAPGNQKLMSILEAMKGDHSDEHERLILKTVDCEEFMEKVDDRENETSKKIAEICMEELEGWYGKTKLEKLNDNYEAYKKLSQESNEKIMDFVRRFQNAHMKLEKEGTPMHPYLLALDLLKKSNLNETEIKATIAICDMEKEGDEVYQDVINHLRKMKSSFSNENKNSQETAFYGQNNQYYKQNNQQRGRSKDKRDYRDKNGRGKSGGPHRSYSNKRDSRGQSQGHSKSQSNRGKSKSRSQSNKGQPRSQSKHKSKERIMVDEQGRKFLMTPVEDPTLIHLTSEKAKALTYFTDKDNLTTKSVNQAIVDNGCPTNVAGRPWVKLYAESRGVKQFKTEKCSKVFKFGQTILQVLKCEKSQNMCDNLRRNRAIERDVLNVRSYVKHLARITDILSHPYEK